MVGSFYLVFGWLKWLALNEGRSRDLSCTGNNWVHKSINLFRYRNPFRFQSRLFSSFSLVHQKQRMCLLASRVLGRRVAFAPKRFSVPQMFYSTNFPAEHPWAISYALFIAGTEYEIVRGCFLPPYFLTSTYNEPNPTHLTHHLFHPFIHPVF